MVERLGRDGSQIRSISITHMHVVSLLPAGTEWLAAFGALKNLVARSHGCDYPQQITHLPILTRPAISVEGNVSNGIDRAVREQLQRGLDMFEIDLERLTALKPDIILTRSHCNACDMPLRQTAADLSADMGTTVEIFSFDPQTFKQVLEQAMRLARRLGRVGRAMTHIAEGEKRLRSLQDRIGFSRHTPAANRPKVLCIEWMDPIMLSGNWVPDLVELAGGSAVGPKAGRRSTCADWQEILRIDPDVIAVMPCGYPTTRTRAEFSALTHREAWQNLSAVQQERVYVFDGHAYFNRPGPRLYRSIELLAAAIHGPTSGVAVQPDEVVRLRDASRAAG